MKQRERHTEKDNKSQIHIPQWKLKENGMFHSLYKSKLYACILYNGKKVMEKISSKSLDLHAQQKCNKVVASQIAPPPPDKFLGMFPLSIFSHRQTSPGAE